MTVSPVEVGFTIPPTGAQLETPGMPAVAPFMTPPGGDEGGAGPGGRRFCRSQEGGSVWWWRGSSVQRSEQQPRASFPGRFAGPVVWKTWCWCPGELASPGSRPGTPRYQLATGYTGGWIAESSSRRAEFLEDAWAVISLSRVVSRGGAERTSDDHVLSVALWFMRFLLA